jgi:hypothetical protein
VNSERYQQAFNRNLRSAVSTCLLLDFRPTLDEEEFLYTIVSLSYVGDVRFKLGGENKSKVENIVKVEHMSQFREVTLNSIKSTATSSSRTAHYRR